MSRAEAIEFAEYVRKHEADRLANAERERNDINAARHGYDNHALGYRTP